MTTANSATGSSGWKVTHQRQTQDIGPGGAFIPIVEVFFTTGRGVAGSVKVPLTDYSPEGIYNAVAPLAASFDAVSSIVIPPEG